MQLAQINVARLRFGLEAPETADFVAALAPVNALADAAPGFVWRLQTADGDATTIRAYDDDLVIVNQSVWASLDALVEFVFEGDHLAVMRHRLDWFERWPGPHTALWWVADGGEPSADEGRRRLELLAGRGPTPDAFDLAHPFAADGAPVPPPRRRARC